MFVKYVLASMVQIKSIQLNYALYVYPMPKIKSGEQITWKEFFHRWKEGIGNLTPLQQVSNERIASAISLVGFIVSLIAIIIFHEKFIVSYFAYGLILIFVGSIISNFFKLISLSQTIKKLKTLDKNALTIDVNKIFKELESTVVQTEEVKGGKK